MKLRIVLAAALGLAAIVQPAVGRAATHDRASSAACSGLLARKLAPDADAPATLQAVSGATATAVFAAGDAQNANGIHRTYVVRWNGSGWAQETTPNGMHTDSYLTSIDAVSATNVWAVGYTENGNDELSRIPLILHRTSAGWTLADPPTVGDSAALWGISAVSGSDIWAVGVYIQAATRHTLALHWNGTAWTKKTTVDVGTKGAVLQDIDASSATNAWATGYSISAFDLGPLLERWDGFSWQDATPGTWTSGSTGAVATRGPSNTWVARTNGISTSTILSHWNGTSWTDEPSDPAVDSPLFLDLDIVAGNDVWVAGRRGPATGSYRPLVEHWNGLTWKVVPTPYQLGYLEQLNGIDPAAGADRFAVGTTKGAGYNDHPIALRASPSTWQLQSPPNRSKLPTALDAVSASSSSNVWAVGTQQATPPSVGSVEFVERWDGTAWREVRTPLVAALGAFRGVAALSPSDVWVVGEYHSFGANHGPLIMHWNGAHWSVTTFPPFHGAELYSVHATAAKDVWAVGYRLKLNGDMTTTAEPVALHWDGSWGDRSPAEPGGGGQLIGVDAVGAADAVAVGADDGFDATLAEHWGGLDWSIQTSGSPGNAPYNVLFDVATTTGARWAVGRSRNAAEPVRTLIEKKTSSGWTRVTSPQPGTGDRALYGVDDVSATDLWAVGFQTVFGVSRNLVVHRTTGNWRAVSVPNVGDTSHRNELAGVDALSSGEVWAVGDHSGPSGNPHVLVLHACGA
jgi:hypothetical protein